MTQPQRCGFAALIGRPNVGKSTLLNRLTGEKLAIVSPKPQTTRNRIMGVVTSAGGQVAFWDTPGIHPAKGELNRFMVRAALSAAHEVDLEVFMTDVAQGARGAGLVGADERFILEKLRTLAKPALLVLNKIDTIPKPLLLPLIDAYRKAFSFADILPISALTGDGVDELLEVALSHLPEGAPMFERDVLTDQAERTLVAELVREQVLRLCHQELPYSAAVLVDIFDESERAPREASGRARGRLSGLVRIEASIFVERESQKAIVIGRRGQMLKAIGTEARRNIEGLLGTHLYLSLRVRVEPRWSERRDGLAKFGYR